MSELQKVYERRVSQERLRAAIRSVPIWVGAGAFMIVLLLAFATVSANQQVSEVMARKSFLANPELSAAQRYAELAAERRASLFLAGNPELKSVRASLQLGSQREDTGRFIINPEILSARNYIEMFAAAEAEIDLHVNPELKILQARITSSSGRSTRPPLTINPELRAHRRFAADMGN
jgi:hypothetical protein